MSVITAENRSVLPMETKNICERSDMEETGTHNTKVSDSGYSNSCSNSQSQRSGSGSSKSRHSGSSSGSSGYCGHPSTLGSSNDSFQQPSTMKRKEYKKKKLKAMAGELLNDTGGVVTPGVSGPLETIPAVATSPLANIEPAFLTTGSSQTIEKENIQLNPLSHPTLSLKCIKKLKGKDLITGEEMCEGTPSTDGIDSKDDSKVVADNTHKSSSRKEEFSAVVSMQEGVVLYTTNSVTDVLGYPKDMWLGRSLINFVHPKDRKAFNSHITSGIATPLNDRRTQNVQNAAICKRNSFYCCLRQYRGLKSSGFGVTNKKVSYIPCQLTLAFREISNKNPVLDNNEMENDVDIKEFAGDQNVVRAILLIVTARLVHSVYKIPDEVCASSTYTTRHSTSMLFTHVDSEIVTYFGYLPQDMIGRSVFEFYHPEDLPYLKEVYENVFKDKGQPFRSKPYRFRTQNGGFAVIETEWSSFVNPWTKKIEFVGGQHRVIKGPPNPDVTTPDIEPEPLQISEEVLKESNMIQEEIINILNESAEAQDSTKYQMTKYCKELLTFIENVLDEDKTNSDKSESKPVSLSITDRDSVMLGEISPHHEYYDSKSSSETPPSYTQLNYNDNIQRFFESKPKTTLSDESGDSKTSLCNERNTQSSGGDEEGKISPPVDSSCGGSHNSGLNNESGGSSDLSFGNSSGGAAGVGNGVGVGGGTGAGGEAVNGGGGGTGNSNNNNTTTSGPVNKYRTPHLTEELLSKHNENMEKKLVQRHRERSKSDRENKLKDGRHKKNYDKILDEQNAHGVKRSGSHSWEGEPFKSIKQTHAGNEPVPESNTTSAPKIFSLPQTTVTYTKPDVTSSANINLWPPFSVSVTPLHSTQPCTAHMGYSATPLHNTMLPLYYVPPEIPPPPNRTSNNNNSNNTNINNNNSSERGPPTLSPYIQPSPGTYMAGQFQYYLSSMMYHPVPTPLPMFGVPPVMYSPITMLPAPLLSTQPMKPQAQQPQNNCNNTNTSSQMDQSGDNNKKAQRPSSQATSVKAEPGSALCSIASNSLQQAMSETSKREGKSLGIPSPQSLVSHDSPEKTKADLELDVNSNDLLDTSLHNDSSSYYSSFYSFMKADEKSDESMKSMTENDSSVETSTDNKQEVPPWLENVSLTPDLLFRYQVSEKNLSDVLEADLKILTEIQQPLMVNDQLCQLYLDLERYHQADCALETSMGFTSSSGTSSGEGDEHPLSSMKTKKKYRSMEYHDKMVMLFEENAPMPSPLSHSNGPTLLSIQTT